MAARASDGACFDFAPTCEFTSALYQSVATSVRRVVDISPERVEPQVHDPAAQVSVMGSRAYQLACVTSDLDLYAALPVALMDHRHDILRTLATQLVASQQSLRGMKGPVLQGNNDTLKWMHPSGLHASLLLSSQEVVDGALAATRILQRFAERYSGWLPIIRDLLCRLRGMGALNPHGRASVQQHLKTAPFCLLAAALVEHGTHRAESPDSHWLLAQLSSFRADALRVQFDDRVAAILARHHETHPPLLIKVNGRNSAGRVTHPVWARFQLCCRQLLGGGVCPCSSITPSDYVAAWHGLSPGSGGTFRFSVSSSVWWGLPKDDMVVATASWGHRLRPPDACCHVLAIFTGTANETYAHVNGYDLVLQFTWCLNWESNPVWAPKALLGVLQVVRSHFAAARLDVLGISRGVQAVLCSFDSSHGIVAELTSILGSVVLAGGCLWQRQDPGITQRVLQGLSQYEASSGQKPVLINVVSEMDGSTSKRGTYSAGRSNVRVDYGDLAEQLAPHTSHTVVHLLSSHGDVCAQGLSAIKELGQEKQACPDSFIQSAWAPTTLPRFDYVEGAWSKALRESSLDAGRHAVDVEVASCTSTEAAARQYLFCGNLRQRTLAAGGVQDPLVPVFRAALSRAQLCWVSGTTGVGKSTRTPRALIESRTSGGLGVSVCHVLHRKLPALSLHDFYCMHSQASMQQMSCVWNGDEHMWPRQSPFVALTTPASLYHRLRGCIAWHDIGYFVLDEFHCKSGLLMLLFAFFVYLFETQDPRAHSLVILHQHRR